MRAAEDRFTTDGYVATTIESVADAAGVAVQTVYHLFGTKPKLLGAVLDTATSAGTTAPVVDREWVERVATAGDAEAAVSELAAGGTAIVARAAPLYDVVSSAASIPEVAELLTENHRRRRTDQRHLAELLAAAGHLGPDVTVDHAADVLYAVLNEPVYLLLTGDCGWSVERYRGWVAELLLAQLT